MYKVLLVDDENIIKIGLKTTIDWESKGFCIVDTADNGLDALNKIHSLKPDVIFTDMVMPVMGGLELISTLKAQHYPGLYVVLSSYSDIELVKKALRLGAEDYILKMSYNQNEFNDLLDSLSVRLKNRNTLDSDWHNNESFFIKAFLLSDEYSHSIIQNEFYQLFMIKLPESVLSLTDDLYQELYRKIRIILEECIKCSKHYEYFQVKKGLLLFCFSTGSTQLKTSTPLPERIHKTLSMYLLIDTSILYYLNVSSNQELKNAYNQCIENIKITFYRNVCLPSSQVVFHSIHELINPIKLSNRYKNYLKCRDYEHMQNELQQIILNFQENYVDPLEIKDFLHDVVITIQLYFDEVYHNNIFPNVVSKIKNATKITDLNNIINEIFDEIILTDSHFNQENLELAECIKNYIDTHIDTRLSLNAIAAAVNFHPNYISTYFHQKTGQTISYYINSQKMRYAKTLLNQKQFQIKEISEKVGFDDPLYFSRCFKKFFGYSPTKSDLK